MTVINTVNAESVDGDGTTVAFNFTFKLFEASELQVYKVVKTTRATTLQTITTDYTVSINTASEGGTVTFVTAPFNTEEVLMMRVVPNTQPLDLPVVGRLTQEQMENQLDRQVMMIQQLDEILDRTIQVAIGSNTPVTVPALVAGGVLTNDGTSLTWSVLAGTGDMLLAAVQSVTGAKTFDTGTLILDGSTSGTCVVNAPAVAGTTIITMPGATGTLVTLAGTETLTNKTIAGGSNTVTGLVATTALSATGTKNNTTFLRGDDTWAAPSLLAGYGALHGNNISANIAGIDNTTPVVVSWLNTSSLTAVNATVNTVSHTIVVTNAGDYRVEFFVTFSGGSTGRTYLFGVYKNGTITHIAGNVRNNSTIVDRTLSISGLITLAASDSLDVRVLSDSGSSLTIGAGSRNAYAGFSVNRIA